MFSLSDEIDIDVSMQGKYDRKRTHFSYDGCI
jgi:hypothetical protein